MLSGVLRSKQATRVNIKIMRAFVRLREMLTSKKILDDKLRKLEQKYDQQFKIVFDAIQELMTPIPTSKRVIGFIWDTDKNKK